MSEEKRAVPLSTLGTIIRKGLEGDVEGVRAYAELLAENAEKDGATETAKFVREVLDPNQKVLNLDLRASKDGPRVVGKIVNGKMVLNKGEER